MAELKQAKQDYCSLWFQKEVVEGERVFTSNDRYWEEKIKNKWGDCSDLY